MVFPHEKRIKILKSMSCEQKNPQIPTMNLDFGIIKEFDVIL
jgi:hypothetical protein